MTLAKEATPLLEWGCLTPQQKLMVQLLVVLFFSVIAVPLPLLIPINDPNEGALKNMTFFYGYNIFVIVYYLPGHSACTVQAETETLNAGCAQEFSRSSACQSISALC